MNLVLVLRQLKTHLLVFFVLIAWQGAAQSDTGRVLPVFEVVEFREEYNPYDLDQEEIENEPNHQINEVLQKMPGINIRDYGGYGGVKTYSARGLGAQHSGVIINGVPQSLTFGGVVDLSNLPIENVASMQMGQSFTRTIPQSALTYRNANVLFIEDQNNIFSYHPKITPITYCLRVFHINLQSYFLKCSFVNSYHKQVYCQLFLELKLFLEHYHKVLVFDFLVQQHI